VAKDTFASPAERIIVALDVDDIPSAREMAHDIQDLDVTFKIGNQMGTYEGWKAVIDFTREFNAHVFCDTKFKDIPETVKKSARAITRHQPDFFTIMADNSLAALQAAIQGVESACQDYDLAKKPLVIGVTVLTSISDKESHDIYGASATYKVQQFAKAAVQAGLDGIVCSAKEAALLRTKTWAKDLLLVTPGIRPVWAATNDQSRVVTPRQAIANGADYLVIGRPVTQPPSHIGTPRDALLKIIEEIS
jgi:orotidine-5'-phosphate decarboxylase